MNGRHEKRLIIWLLLTLVVLTSAAAAQDQPMPSSERAVAQNGAQAEVLEQRLDQLMHAVDGVQQQIMSSQRAIEELGTEMRQIRMQLAGNAQSGTTGSSGINGSSNGIGEMQAAVEQLRQESQVQAAEIKQHEQTKVESVSKFPVKLSGLVLFSSFLNDGAVDDIDLPGLALARTPENAHGSLAATMRQSILGVEAVGPHLWGARSSADVHVDFFGGLPYAAYTTSAGTVRLRTAHVNLDWPHTTAVASFDTPLISPLQPTSIVSQGLPALAWSGNLWVWSPQIKLRHRQDVAGGTAGFELGLIDPASPGLPGNQALRTPGAGESSRQPGYEGRLSYAFGREDHALSVGGGGYYTRQRYRYGPDNYPQHVDGWASTADWRLPIQLLNQDRLELSGEFYRGRAIGGLGGGAFKDYFVNAISNHVHGLDAEGGWAQFKVRATRELEANAAFGLDGGFTGELRSELQSGIPALNPDIYSSLARNRTVLGNVIFRPRAYLVFSAEYRNIRSWNLTGPANTAGSLGLAGGYSF